MKFKQTRHQVPRGTRADAEKGETLYLLKKVPTLHATYQVRLLAFRAQKEGKRLVIRAPKVFEPAPSLKRLMVENPHLIRIERGED
jgi:hypothetical protein